MCLVSLAIHSAIPGDSRMNPFCVCAAHAYVESGVVIDLIKGYVCSNIIKKLNYEEETLP